MAEKKSTTKKKTTSSSKTAKAKAVKKAKPKKTAATKSKKSTKKKDSTSLVDRKPRVSAPIVSAPKSKTKSKIAPKTGITPKITAPPKVVAPPKPKPVQPSKPTVKKPAVPMPKPVAPQPVRPKPQPTAAPVAKSKSAPASAPKKKAAPTIQKPKEPEPTPVPVEEESGKTKIIYNEMMTVKDLADAMKVQVTDVIKKLLGMGSPATINQRIETEVATLVADSLGFELEVKSIYEDENIQESEKEGPLESRSPVVTVMGHVDHGKTSLLDAIRSTKVVDKEHGGITQHIGAYQVKTSKGLVTFLDTPGHEAFTAMRARGATVTDLVVLVVAADDSVMPQTVEAIDHAKAANVPIVVAINKCDLPAANIQKVKQELSQHELIAEDWGGKTQMVEVSAKTGDHIDDLLELIGLEAELLELKANPNRPARGVVLEAKLDQKRGVTSTVLIQTGTLKVGDVVVCGLSSGRIRAMLDENRKQLNSAGPSVPVEILGLTDVPHVGDQLSVVRSDREAREIAERRREHVKDSAQQGTTHVSLESLHSRIEAGNIQQLNIILKADVQGSLQAIQDTLGKIQSPLIQLRFIHTGVGNINDSDVLLAETSDSILFGFNVKTESSAEAEAKKAGVDIRLYNIIYEILADVRAALEGLIKPVEVEKVKGLAVVKSVFPSARYGKIAGCKIQEGKVIRGQKAKLIRNGEVLGSGPISSLKRFKDDVKEVDKGYECGIAIEGVRAYEPDDTIEIFVIEKQARRLEN